MKTYRKTLALLALFFTGLLALWGLERAGVLTERERRLREGRIFPELIDTPPTSIQKVAIERGTTRMVFEQRRCGIGHWQMTEPVDAAADPSRLETLVRNLKDLRKSADSGSITGPTESFELDPPFAKIAIWGTQDSSGGSADRPLATLAIGKSIRGERFVRSNESQEIDVVDAKLLGALDSAPAEWREMAVMGVPTFQVASVLIERPGEAIRAERNRRGQWRLSQPIRAPRQRGQGRKSARGHVVLAGRRR